MAGVTRKHSLYGIAVDSTILKGITRQMLSTGTEVLGEISQGGVYRRFQSIVGQKPVAEFSSLAIVTALDNIGLTGTDISGLTAGLTFYAQKHAKGATRASGANHRKYNATEGLIFPRRLSIDHQGNATLEYDVIFAFDGTNDPFVITDSVSLPALPTDDERFTIGPVQIGGVTLDHVRAWDIAFGINAVSEGADSEIWDRFVSIETIEPTLTFRGIDVEWMKAANIPLAGKPGTHANTIFYLRKRAAGASFVADGTAEHVKFTADGLAYIDTAMDASGSGAAETVLVMPLEYDDANDPLTIDTSAAIT